MQWLSHCQATCAAFTRNNSYPTHLPIRPRIAQSRQSNLGWYDRCIFKVWESWGGEKREWKKHIKKFNVGATNAICLFNICIKTSPFPIRTFPPVAQPSHILHPQPAATWSLLWQVSGSTLRFFSVRLRCSLLVTDGWVHADSSDSCHIFYTCVWMFECVRRSFGQGPNVLERNDRICRYLLHTSSSICCIWMQSLGNLMIILFNIALLFFPF